MSRLAVCHWGPPSLVGPRCEASLVGAVWVVPLPQFPTRPQHQGKWATKAMPLLNAPLGMLIDLLLRDKQKVCVSVHLGKIKSTGLAAWHRVVCVDSFNLRSETLIYNAKRSPQSFNEVRGEMPQQKHCMLSSLSAKVCYSSKCCGERWVSTHCLTYTHNINTLKGIWHQVINAWIIKVTHTKLGVRKRWKSN